MNRRRFEPTLAFVLGILGAAATAAADPKPACPPKLSVALHVVAKGVWLGNSSGARCFVPRSGGALDGAAIETEIAAVAGGCTSAVEVTGSGVMYQDLIMIMDLAVKRGLIDVGLSAPGALSVKLDDSAAAQRAAAVHCTGPATAAPAAPAPPVKRPAAGSGAQGAGAQGTGAQITGVQIAGAKLPPASSKAALADAPVVIVTPKTAELRQGTSAPVSLGTTAKLAAGKGTIEPLVKSLTGLPAPSDPRNKGVVILQADASVDVALVLRIVDSCKAAGFDNVLFAVKNKS